MTAAQVAGCDAIEGAWEAKGDDDDAKFAYLLATAFHETARTMQPVRETLAKTDAKAKEILTKAFAAGKLKWVKKDYWSSGYFGRGYVQLTHLANYQKAEDELGYPFVKEPSLALNDRLAALILVRGCLEGWFTGKKLGDYIKPGQANFLEARRVVNGTDRAALIAGHAFHFEKALEAARKVKPAPAPVTPPYVPTGSVPTTGNPLGWLIAGVIAVAAALAGWGQSIWNWLVGLFS